MSATSSVAPRLMIDSSCSRIWPALDTSMCSGSVTTACTPVHCTGQLSSGTAGARTHMRNRRRNPRPRWGRNCWLGHGGSPRIPSGHDRPADQVYAEPAQGTPRRMPRIRGERPAPVRSSPLGTVDAPSAVTARVRRPLPWSWHHHDRAVRVVDHLLADRAEHQPREPAAAP